MINYLIAMGQFIWTQQTQVKITVSYSTSKIMANSKLSIAALQTNFHALRLSKLMGINFDVSFQLQLEQWLNLIKKNHSTNLIEKFVNILASPAKR